MWDDYFQVKGQKPPAPIRGLEAAGEADDDADADDDDADKESDGPNIVDILPRNDIRCERNFRMLFWFDACHGIQACS